MKLLLALLLLAGAPALAGDAVPAAGSFGFDWLDPDKAACRALDEDTLRRFKHCETDRPGFCTHKPTHACRIGEDSE